MYNSVYHYIQLDYRYHYIWLLDLVTIDCTGIYEYVIIIWLWLYILVPLIHGRIILLFSFDFSIQFSLIKKAFKLLNINMLTIVL